MSSGIYQIRNLVNGNRYVGSAKNLRRRQTVHLSALRHNRHVNPHLQNVFNKYGKEAFVFEIVEQCAPEECTTREQHFLDTLHPEYNIALSAIAPMLGRQASRAPRLDLRGKTYEEIYGSEGAAEKKARMRASMKRLPPRSEEHCRKLSENHRGMTGRKHSVKTRRKISEGRKRWWAAQRSTGC